MIFTDRTIMVKNGTSSINDTIVLYRGDRDVEIRFTLNEGSPFKFGSGASPNIIEKTEATYGQLVVKTPGNLPPIFSEVAPTIGGKIIFAITAEMIDEITEVGNYTFQIRLLDDSMESRATLPEVKNGIEIREPIALEDISTTNEVDVAAVGYALTTAGTAEDAFDAQGNYNKTTWGTGDRITAAKLNKIENGIESVNQKVASGGTSSGGEVDLSSYAKKTDIPTKISQLTNDSSFATETYVTNEMETIKAELNSQIEGKVALSELELLKGKMPYSNNDNIDCTSRTSTTFIIKENEPINFSIENEAAPTIYGRNRFDLENTTFSMSGYSSSYTLTKKDNGLLISTTITNTTSAHYAYFDYIAEFDGDLYLSCNAKLISGKINTVCMSALLNGTLIEQVYGEGLLYIVIPVTKGDTVRCCFYGHLSEGVNSTVAYKDIMISYNGLYEFTKYVNNKHIGSTDIIKTINLSDSISSATYKSTPKIIYFTGLLSDAFSLPSTNAEIVQDVTVNNESLPMSSYATLYNSTDNGIAVTQTGDLALRVNGMNKTNVTAWLAENPVTVTYKTGETLGQSKYIDNDDLKPGIIIGYPTEQTATYYFSKSTKNKKLVCFGDSITGMYDGKADYPFMIQMDSDIETVNCGFAGCQYTDHKSDINKPFCMNRIVDSIVANDYAYQEASGKVNSSDTANYSKMYDEHLTNLKNIDWNTVDYVSLFWGTNDWGADVILKSVDDVSEADKQRTNVEDSIKYCIEKLLTKYPHLKILVVCPYWRAISSGKDSNKDANKNGTYLYEFSDFIEETVRKNYNLPVINLYWNLGANAITNRYFTKDGTHPTEQTKHMIANRIIDCINKY